MATEQQVKLFKINLGGVEGIWEDQQISDTIDATGSVSKATRAFWYEKVNESYRFMDVTESSSSRALSTIYRNAQEQLTRWDAIVAKEDLANERETVGRVRFGDITR
jgi:hypothetical protein